MYAVIEHSASSNLVAKIDRFEFNENELVTIKVPLKLPYQQNWKEFERFDGDVTVDGIHYKYVMRKVYNDSLILKCLPNETKKHLNNAERNYFQLVNDLDHQGPQPEKTKASFFKNLVTEFWEPGNTFLIDNMEKKGTASPRRTHSLTSSGYLNGNDHPPQA